MILFTTVDNIILESRIHFPHGIKMEQYEYSPLSTTFFNELINGLGGYYIESLKKANKIVVYKEFEDSPTEKELLSEMTYITYLFSIAWYIKYNTFQIGDVWYIDMNTRTVRKIGFGYTVSGLPNSKKEAITLNNSEVDRCAQLLETFFSFNFSTKFELNLGATDNTKLSILQRTAELIELSKLAPNIYHKIGLLCSALECLFTTDSTEVTHKVCERVAFFLSNIPAERISISQKIKVAYAHRSNFFHGNKLKNIDNKVFFDIDDIVRQVMIKALTEKADIFKGTVEHLNQYFVELIFGNDKKN